MTTSAIPVSGPGTTGRFRAQSLQASAFPAESDASQPAAQVEIVVPVTSEQRDLALSIIRLHAFLTVEFPFSAHVTIAATGDSDDTWAIARKLAGTFSAVSAVWTETPGRGLALRAIWSRSQCDVLAYLDADLSIDLGSLLPLIEPLLAGDADVGIGTRLAAGAGPQLRPRREITSCGYSLLLQAGLGTGFADAQCGLKAIRHDRAQELLPLTSEIGWFFDTELLILAERAGLRIREVPVNQVSLRARTGLRPASVAAAVHHAERFVSRIFRGNAA